MSKIKMSFSLILAILLVGILSTVALAKDPYGLKPAQVQDTLNLSIPFTNNTAAGETAGTTYDLKVYDSNTVVDHWDAITSAASPVTATNLTPGTVYTVKLTLAGQSTVLSQTTAVTVNPYGQDMYKANGTAAAGTLANSDHVDVTGTGLINSNTTGYNNTRKNRTGQKVHGFYQNNTNSCASCHQTHGAANGEALLFKDGTYSTCSACHDGTTGAYNSFAPTSADTVKSIDGSFNVHDAGQNGSLHVADGSLDVSAAPGGNNNPDTTNAIANATWGSEFDCASCHSAHGGGSAGENNLSIDPLGWGGVQYSATGTTDQKNGKLFKNDPIYNGIANIPKTMTTPFILVRDSAQNINNPTSDKTKSGYLYYRAGLTDGTTLVLQTYRWDGSKYTPDFSLWLRDVGHKGAPFANANTVLKDSTGADITTTGMTVIWRDGFAFGAGVNSVASADISIGIDVETTSDIASLYDSTNANYVVDSGTEMSKYCASCHIDYLSGTRTNNTGVYTVAHRHATAQDRLTCVRCHYAHGSEASIMKDANDNNYFGLTANGMATSTALSYLTDPNPSSALKRYTGMSVCYACHGKGEYFLGNPNINGDSTTGQFLKNGDPGTNRTDLTTRHNASGNDQKLVTP